MTATATQRTASDLGPTLALLLQSGARVRELELELELALCITPGA